MNIIDLSTRMPVAPVTLAPFNPVIATTAAQATQGTLNQFALDFMLLLKDAGCEPCEVFAVASIMESLTRDHSKVVDVSPEEADMVWNLDRFA